MEYFVKVEGGVRMATEAELADVAVELYTTNEAGNLVAVDRSLLPVTVDVTTPASTAPAAAPAQSDALPATTESTQPDALPPAPTTEDEISEPTEDERFSALVETTVDILHTKGWAFGNELQALINRFK
jgi:hypothetical protein